MRIWITGAEGQIGSALTPKLLARGHQVAVLSRQRPTNMDDLSWIHWDAGDPEALPQFDDPPSALIHLAAQTSAYVARQDPVADLITNVVGPLSLIQHIAASGAMPHVISAGSITQNGFSQLVPLEGQCVTFYEVGKESLELYLSQVMREGKIDYTSLRVSNVYGGKVKTHSDRGFINRSIAKAVSGQPIEVFGGRTLMRDYIHVDDVAGAFTTALESRSEVRGKIFPIGTGESFPILEAANIIRDIVLQETGVQAEIRLVEPPVGHYEVDMQDRRVDPLIYFHACGWRSAISFQEGVRRQATAVW